MRWREEGSGSVLAVGVAAAILCLAAVVVPLYAVLAVRSSVAGAADAAALAAADARVGAVSGYPCVRASQAAAANDAMVTACTVDGLVVTITVQRQIAGFTIEQTATAGPGD